MAASCPGQEPPMPRAAVEPPVHRTVADLLKVIRTLGDIPADRIRLHPDPGTATEQDVLDVQRREGRTCELINGTLVEKVMGMQEARLAIVLGFFLESFLSRHNLGIVTGPDGTLKLTTGLLRIPDVMFVSWDHLPGREFPAQPIPRLTIDLAVEVISKGNTKAEMERKLREYFEAGTRLVWFLYPKNRTARVYTSPGQFTRLTEDQTLDGGNVLPGFTLSLRELFERAFRGPDA
jgi:Uma2 family endonuclease